MRERVAAAAVVLLVLFGAGVLIDQLWLSSPAPAPVAVEREPVSTPDSSLASTSASNLGPRESDGVVTRIGGTLLRSSAGVGLWSARVGDVVPAGSSLRTEGGSATIDFSSASVELFDRSEVQLEADADA